MHDARLCLLRKPTTIEEYEAAQNLMRSIFKYMRAQRQLTICLLLTFALFAPDLYKAAARLLGWA
jgi:hypothetical protein